MVGDVETRAPAGSQSQEQQAFLLALSDALRPLAEAAEIQATTTRLLGTYLGVDRSMYAEVEGAPGAETGTVRGQYVRLVDGGDPPIVPFPERFTYSPFGARTMAGRYRGELLVVTDVDADPTFETAERTAWAAAGVRAAVVAPLVKGGRLVAEFGVHSAAPRAWTAAEVALVQDVAERTWAAAERARAETALRTNQQRLRAQKEAFEAAIDGLPLAQCLGILARLVIAETAGEARTQFYRADPDGLHLHPIRGAGDMPDDYLDLVDGFLIGTDSLACGLSTATARPIVTRDVFDEPLWQPWVHIATAHDHRGSWSFPIDTREGRTVGTFAMYFRTAREPAPHERALAELVTQTAAIIIARDTEAQERARAEAELRRSEQRLRTATSAARISTFEIDVASGMLELDANVLAVLYGIETVPPDQGPQDWGPLVQAWLRPEDAQRHTELLRATMRGEGDLHNELLVRDPATGAETWIEAQASLVRDPPGGPDRVFGIMRNITQRKQTEAALRESEAKYRSLFESIDQAFGIIELIHDEAERAVDFRYLEVNDAFERHVGVAGIAGKLRSEVAPGTRSSWLDIYAEVARTGQAKRFEDHREGRWYDIYASRVGPAGSWQVAVLFKDLTERKRREERQAFLLKLGDALRPMADPVQVQATAARLLGEYLDANQVHYGETLGADTVVIHQGYGNGLPPMVGTFHQSREGWGARLLDIYQAGRTAVCSDVDADPTITSDEAAAIAGAGFHAYIAVPLVKAGVWVATLAVHSIAPRAWTADEIALVEETAQRTWAAVERARAEAALRASEARLRRILDADAVGVVFFDQTGTLLDANTAFWQMTGYTPADAQNGALHWRTMTPPEWVQTSEAQMQALAATGRIGPYEKEYQRKDGSRLWLMFAGRDLGDGTIVEFVIDVSDRKQLEAERERLVVAEAVAAERQALLEAVVRAQEEERRHLARELHDEIGQTLTGLQLQLAAFARGQNGRAAAMEAEQIVRDLTARVSNLSVDLRPSALDTLGLLPALLSHVERLQARAGLRIDLRHDGLDRHFSPPVEITAYRVVQEALTNVVRHSGARSVTVHLLADDDMLTLAVRDDGRGFDPHAIRGTGGLSGMRERVELLGGTLTIDTTPEEGTLITAELPLDDQAAGALQEDGA